ncbi:pumilio RNA-binding region-containing [Babesia ovis]|uniref:Pumilio RNA-binding region-containing n=1 Tax=Babesia ovis TaxID=5869 RepID=A0A9W5WVL5_BABOV|nr:pumilio RNA-binding region-containing [Babesia ovis]
MKLNIQRPGDASKSKGKFRGKKATKGSKSQRHAKGSIGKTSGPKSKPFKKSHKSSTDTKSQKPRNGSSNSTGNTSNKRPLPNDSSNGTEGVVSFERKSKRGKEHGTLKAKLEKSFKTKHIKPKLSKKRASKKPKASDENISGVTKKLKESKQSKEDEVKEINKLYSQLLVEHRKQEVVTKTIKELIRKIGTENYSIIANKRHISRVLQACLKYGDTSTRSMIFESLKKDFNVTNLNVHSARFLIKVFNYCNVDAKAFLRTSFFNDRNKVLLYSRYGSLVMDVIYQKLRNKEQLEILRLYTLSNHFIIETDAMKKIEQAGSLHQFIAVIDQSESRATCVEMLKLAVLKMVDKAQLTASLSHDLIYVYWKLAENKTELMNLVGPVFGQLLSTRNGNTVLCDLYGYADKKLRKSILKGLKTDFPEAAYNQVNVSFIVKTALATDDTKMTIECLIKPLQDDLAKLVSHPHAHLLLKSILEPAKDVESVTSLKDLATRQQELQEYLLPLLVDLFKSIELREVIENKPSCVILQDTLKTSGNPDILYSVVDVLRDDMDGEMKLLQNLDTLRFLQSLIKKPGDALASLKPYREFWPVLKTKVKRILSSQCVFILVDIVEAALKEKDDETVEDFKSVVTVSTLKETSAALKKKKEKHVGVDILLKLLS